MSELEEARKGDRPFGMSFIRANCTAVSVNVFRMVKCMDQLAPCKYIGPLRQLQVDSGQDY